MKKKIDNNTNEENSKNAKKIIRRNLRLEARVTEKEYFQATELAKTCGLSISDYIRRTALGQHPRQRLSEREIEALCSLADARGTLSVLQQPLSPYKQINEPCTLVIPGLWNNG